MTAKRKNKPRAYSAQAGKTNPMIAQPTGSPTSDSPSESDTLALVADELTDPGLLPTLEPEAEAGHQQADLIPSGGSHTVTAVSDKHPSVKTAVQPGKKWTRGRIARWAAGIAGLALLLGVGWIAYLVIRFQGRIYVELPPTPTARAVAVMPTSTTVIVSSGTSVPTVEIEPTPDRIKALPAGRINILILGTDKRENDPDHYARSDTLLLANIDTISHTVHVMSIPRDLIVDIPDYGKNKVNASYFFGEYYKEPGGGQALAVRTISQLFNVPIQYYVAVNFEGFRKVVDTVGGVAIDVPYAIDDYNYPSDDEGDPFGEIHVHFDEGWQYMDGKTALRYARTRHADNDFARSRRQLQVIMAIRQKAMSLDLLPSLPGLIDDLGGMVQTNIPFDQQIGFVQLGYNLSASSIITSSIDATMITPAKLPDGSEGLKLDKKAAQPMLDAFFGWDVASSGSDSSGESKNGPTPKPTTNAKSRATAVPTKVPARSNKP